MRILQLIYMNQKIFLLLIAAVTGITAIAQPTHPVTEPEKKYKEAKDFFVKEQYALAYPLMKELKMQYPPNTASDHTYINDDIDYYYIACELKLMQPIGAEDARAYIAGTTNEPRAQLLSFHLAHYYFLKED